MKTLLQIQVRDRYEDTRNTELVLLHNADREDLRGIEERCIHEYDCCGNWYQKYYHVTNVLFTRLLGKLGLSLIWVFEQQNI